MSVNLHAYNLVQCYSAQKRYTGNRTIKLQFNVKIWHNIIMSLYDGIILS